MTYNLRHLRVFAAVVETGSLTRAAERGLVSQPAVTQTVAKLENTFGQVLLQRQPQSVFATAAGKVLANRINRAFGLLNPALFDLSPRLILTATAAQLQALIATRETESYTRAARRMGLSQPTVHRAVSQLEQEAGRPLFERTPHGMMATRPAQVLAQAARLAFAELAQAEADMAELAGHEVGRIVVGAMPLSRSSLLPRAIVRFRQHRATLPIKALDGPYEDQMAGLRRGEVDFLISALRDPPPLGDIVQERLFDDGLVFVARKDHPILTMRQPGLKDVFSYPMVVATKGTPTRNAFDAIADCQPPSLVETGSMILMREVLRLSDHLGCISKLQIKAEIDLGVLVRVPVDFADLCRPIGLTFRANWLPTRAQAEFLLDLRAVAAETVLAPEATRTA